MPQPDPWFTENLISPVDGAALAWDAASSSLRSAKGRAYLVAANLVAVDFEVRYGSLGELRRVCEAGIGATRFSADCFFGIGWQPSDAHLIPPVFRSVIAVSEFLRRFATWFPPLRWVADSIDAQSRKAGRDFPCPA